MSRGATKIQHLGDSFETTRNVMQEVTSLSERAPRSTEKLCAWLRFASYTSWKVLHFLLRFLKAAIAIRGTVMPSPLAAATELHYERNNRRDPKSKHATERSEKEKSGEKVRESVRESARKFWGARTLVRES